jgi:peptidoglycan/LPS O-acetylase OafA/YrhL
MSAFTLALSLHSRAGEPLRNFFIRRFFRIAPLYYTALAYYLWQDGLGPRYWLGEAPRVTVANIISTVLFVNGVHPQWLNSTVPGGWSIAVEMTFYLLLPLLMAYATTVGRACTLFFGTAAVAILSGNWLWLHGPFVDARLWGEFLNMYLPSQLPVFCIGLVLYHCVRNRERGLAMPAAPLLWLSALVIIDQHTTMRFPEHIGFAIGFACVGYCLSVRPTWILVNRWTVFTGKLSFSLYLVHFAVLHFASRVFARPLVPISTIDLVLKYLGVVCACSLVAYMTYRLIEIPGQVLGGAIIDHLDRWHSRALAIGATATDS